MSSLAPEKQAELRAWLVAFYQRHNPEKIDGVDTILAKFQGKEHELVYQLERKYAVAPGGPDAAPSLPPRRRRAQRAAAAAESRRPRPRRPRPPRPPRPPPRTRPHPHRRRQRPAAAVAGADFATARR